MDFGIGCFRVQECVEGLDFEIPVGIPLNWGSLCTSPK